MTMTNGLLFDTSFWPCFFGLFQSFVMLKPVVVEKPSFIFDSVVQGQHAMTTRTTNERRLLIGVDDDVTKAKFGLAADSQ
jgi:hypothetical protein